MSQGEIDPIEMLKRMLEIYSPSGSEKELSLFLENVMFELGFDRIWRDKVGNVYGEIGFSGPTVLLCGHMDTVPGWINVKLKDGRLYGRGAVDAKASLAAMIIAAANLKLKSTDGKVIVAGVIDEEGRGRGIKQLIREPLKVDCAIFGEPSGVKNITFAYKGHVRLRVACRTATGHIGAQHLIPNAVEKCIDLWDKIKDVCSREYQSPHGVFYSLTPSLIRISGRGATRSIPDLCVMDIDLRLPPTINCNKAINIIGNIIEKFKEENPGLTLKFRAMDRVEPYVADRETPVIKALKEAIFEETGEEARMIRKTGTGDMNIFGSHFRVPVATYGPGNSFLSHTLDENISIEEYLLSIRIYKKAVEKILYMFAGKNHK